MGGGRARAHTRTLVGLTAISNEQESFLCVYVGVVEVVSFDIWSGGWYCGKGRCDHIAISQKGPHLIE